MTTSFLEGLLAHVGQEKFRPHLETVGRWIAPLDKNQYRPKIITVAGTNGKGQCCFEIEDLLTKKGVSSALFTSPHVHRLEERFRLNQKEISPAELLQMGHQLMQEEGSGNLSFFEFLFVLFIRWAHEKRPQILILEVGLGGRWDATNILAPDVALIASISRDHQEILGNRYDLILREKWGIARAGRPLLTNLSLRYLRELAQSWAQQEGILWQDLSQKGIKRESTVFEQNALLARWGVATLLGEEAPDFSVTPQPLSRRGQHETWKIGLATVVFYSSHNVDGIRQLLRFLISPPYNFGRDFNTLVCGFSRRSTGDLKSMLKSLESAFPLALKILLPLEHPRGLKEEELQALAQEENSWQIRASNRELFLEQCASASEKNILVVGSHFLVAEVQSLLRSLHGHESAQGPSSGKTPTSGRG